MNRQTAGLDEGVRIILPERFQSEKAEGVLALVMDRLRQGERSFVLSFVAVTYIDSSGLSALLAANKRSAAQGATLVLTGLNPEVRNFFGITRLDRVFIIEEDADSCREDRLSPGTAGTPQESSDE